MCCFRRRIFGRGALGFNLRFIVIDKAKKGDTESMMKTYIGCKIIQGRPMSHNEFLTAIKGKQAIDDDESGYMVVYPDGYESWSPTFAFESAYREIIPGELELLKDNSTKKDS